ncbi:hypothetical protein EUTSA_v10015663mg [Eutrema salsugineum]|uniref:Knottin scorpion toxin-like domain-containing protein n=1 Tax=Eutrema salsugineum TaxID=72664 RepID=V4LTQ3_EUTSA|nr:hypothetical protein EUTSA_v10015663mg [Eutrema salsugineum]
MRTIMKTLVALVFTALFIVSSINCRTIPAPTPVYGINQDEHCFEEEEACFYGGDRNCSEFCRENGYFYGACTIDGCCCER